MRTIFFSNARRLLAMAGLLAVSAISAQAQIVWDFATEFPTSGTPANLTVSAVSQGNNNVSGIEPQLITAASPSSGYAGFTAGNNAGIAARTGALDTGLSAFFEFTLTPDSGFKVDLNSVIFGTRSTSTGPTQYSVRTSADGFAADLATNALLANSTWVLKSSAGLTVSSLTPLVVRIYGHSGTGSATAGQTNFRIDDLAVGVNVTPASGTPPTVTSFSPDNGPDGTVVTINGTGFGASPSVTFNGKPAPGATVNGAGTTITVAAPGGASTGPLTIITGTGSVSTATSYTYPAPYILTLFTEQSSMAENGVLTNNTVTRPFDAPLGSPLTVTLTSSNTARATVPATVTIAAGELTAVFPITGVVNGTYTLPATVTISATAPTYAPTSATITVTDNDPLPPAPPPTVVVNKFFNSGTTADIFELLVIGNGTAGTTQSMSGMILKDFSGSMGGDGGAKYTINDVPPFQNVKVGTLIVVNALGTSSDITYDDADDFTLRVSLADTTLFTKNGTGTFDISAADMVMVKATGSDPAGVVGAIHVLASGTAGTQFTNTTGAKLIASSNTSTNLVAYALNSTSTLADFEGTGATGGAAQSTVGAFGVANNATNNIYIRQLRGLVNMDGTGVVSTANATPASPFSGLNIFPRASTGQSAAITVVANAAPGSIASVRVSVPTGFGTPVAGNVVVTGPGAGTPVVAVSGQDVTVSGTAITTANAATITIGGLATPDPTALTDDGNYLFPVLTAGSGGTLTATAAGATVRVVIPIANVRDSSETGVPLDFGKTVAVEGVVTVANFNTAELSGYLQQDGFGVNIFNFDESFVLTKGNRYVILGNVITFRGLTEINPETAASIIDLGPAAAQPVPLVTTIPALLANPEIYEGRLITLQGVSRSPEDFDGWAGAALVTVVDALSNTLDLRFSTTFPTAMPEPAYPVAITGIFTQFAPTTAAPFVGGYALTPRDENDFVTAPPPTYADWAARYPGIGGPDNDADSDGQSNLLEYALGTIPNDRASVQYPPMTTAFGEPAFVVNKGPEAALDPQIVYVVEGSSDLVNWVNITTPNSLLEDASQTPGTITYLYLGESPRWYFRLKIMPPAAP
ncbi:MAG: hypothetical protein JWL81_2414 [Verrucomicrobiales bacterium]|nr:hypothetical protein [Verrucomicrobiales bacterium]